MSACTKFLNAFKKVPSTNDTTGSKATPKKQPISKNQPQPKQSEHGEQPKISSIGQLTVHLGHSVESTDVDIELTNLATSLESVVALINAKSGSPKVSTAVLERLRQLLPPENVFDLATVEDPQACLAKFKHAEELTVIAGGGDGTVGWVLSALDELRRFKPVPVAVMPLGTANDLSRVLGWGSTFKTGEAVEIYLRKVLGGTESKLDRWSITTKPNDNIEIDASAAIVAEDSKANLPLNVINNYFSIGVDAKILHDFSAQRLKNPKSFSSPTSNKIAYIKAYSSDFFKKSCKGLVKSIKEFECDGESIMDTLLLNKYHSIVVLNIPSYASGTNPWNKNVAGFDPQSFSDGQLEVVGFHSEDLMWIRIGVPGDCLSQAKRIRIVTTMPLPMQVDGEPVFLQPSEITIELKNKATMISSIDKNSIRI